MRFQVRITPATEELLQHLEGIDNKYRGKRLVALAAMQLAAMSATGREQQETIVHPKVIEPKVKTGENPSPREARPVPAWIANAKS